MKLLAGAAFGLVLAIPILAPASAQASGPKECVIDGSCPPDYGHPPGEGPEDQPAAVTPAPVRATSPGPSVRTQPTSVVHAAPVPVTDRSESAGPPVPADAAPAPAAPPATPAPAQVAAATTTQQPAGFMGSLALVGLVLLAAPAMALSVRRIIRT